MVSADSGQLVGLACGKPHGLRLQPAAERDLPFARELTRVNMRRYYDHYGLVWQPDAFDAEWPQRESYLVERHRVVVGYLSVSAERTFLYVRDVQLIEACRGEGVGTWAMACVARMAEERRLESSRLKVFKNNPAAALYRRLGYTDVGDEPMLLRMERLVSPAA